MSALTVVALVAALAAAPATDCSVEDATLDWGFKESFRSYISGSIANGEWTVADGAAYETPSFSWTGGSGEYDRGTGEVAFDGSITFTGHDGILNTTVANPVIRFDGDAATLYLDVAGTTQQGADVEQELIDFATLDLSEARAGDAGAVEFTGVPATLTENGAAAFGTYEAGEPLDPIALRFTTDEECASTESTSGLVPIVPVLVAIIAVLMLRLIFSGRSQAPGA